ncbi:hypothetical protein D9757_002424 [Collybiopsis confluens]|uniref:Uncharacterized protein n=1 Tax=Collybiopsis confluens TaxID=2823264 RepID=A0A8H5MF69_9AGAR|nr:hypothetical protein D9757_002424 [Collybiopsis confluens]
MYHMLDFGSSGVALSSAETEWLAAIFDNLDGAFTHPIVQKILSNLENEAPGTNPNLNSFTAFQKIWSKVREERPDFHTSREVYKTRRMHLEDRGVLAALAREFNDRRRQRRTLSSGVRTLQGMANSSTPTPMTSPRNRFHPITAAYPHGSNVNSSSYLSSTAGSQAPVIIPSHQQVQHALGSSNPGYTRYPSSFPEPLYGSYSSATGPQPYVQPNYPSAPTSYPFPYQDVEAPASYHLQQSQAAPHHAGGNQYMETGYDSGYPTGYSQNPQSSHPDYSYYGGGYPNNY